MEHGKLLAISDGITARVNRKTKPFGYEPTLKVQDPDGSVTYIGEEVKALMDACAAAIAFAREG